MYIFIYVYVNMKVCKYVYMFIMCSYVYIYISNENVQYVIPLNPMQKSLSCCLGVLCIWQTLHPDVIQCYLVFV